MPGNTKTTRGRRVRIRPDTRPGRRLTLRVGPQRLRQLEPGGPHHGQAMLVVRAANAGRVHAVVEVRGVGLRSSSVDPPLGEGAERLRHSSR